MCECLPKSDCWQYMALILSVSLELYLKLCVSEFMDEENERKC